MYVCLTCGQGVLTGGPNVGQKAADCPATYIHPEPKVVADSIPQRAAEYLRQANSSLNAPSGAVMLAASCVDAMLKEKGLKDGSLYERIEQAATQHLITDDMAEWAHDIRLDANDERHSDEKSEMPSNLDAKRVVEFAEALGEILFVLPSRVRRGREELEAER